MSKINCQFKLKDLYAIKHALENSIKENLPWLDTAYIPEDKKLYEQAVKDIEHEKKIVDYVVAKINKFKITIEHYSDINDKK